MLVSSWSEHCIVRCSAYYLSLSQKAHLTLDAVLSVLLLPLQDEHLPEEHPGEPQAGALHLRLHGLLERHRLLRLHGRQVLAAGQCHREDVIRTASQKTADFWTGSTNNNIR